MKILVINGPNLNFLGKRENNLYGNITLSEINRRLNLAASEKNIGLIFFQSNHEGDLIDFLQENSGNADGILINPGALTHYGYALRDALTDTNLPFVEVHLSNIEKREIWRKIDVFQDIAVTRIMGKKEKSYISGLKILIKYLKKNGR